VKLPGISLAVCYEHFCSLSVTFTVSELFAKTGLMQQIFKSVEIVI